MSKNLQTPVNENGRPIGESHPRAKYSDGDVDAVLALRDDGWGYKRIGKKMDMPTRTVRDICSGRTRCQTPMGFR